MVVSRSDAKRRQKEGQESPSESPKRTKVHAQRKFAQGSNLNTPVLTPVKDKDKSKVNGTVVSTQLLPTKRPNTEDFLNFLCFRGTPILPPKLEFFNVATTPEQVDDDTKVDQSTPGTSKISTRSEKNTPEQTFTVAKAETRSRNKPKTTAAVQAFKKKYQEQQLAKQKMSLTKLALKVKGKNMVRTRSASILEENRRLTKTVSQGTSSTNIPLVKAKPVQKPTIKKQLKRLVPKHVVGSLRGGLRSGGELPPGSDVGLKTERKPRIIKEQELSKNKQLGKRLKNQTIKAIASSLSDFSSDDDQPLVKKQKINQRNKKQHLNISSIRPNQLRLRSNRPPIVKHIVPNRPTRKTKEAAALFLEEMIGKDLRSPDEDSDYIDEDFTDKSYLEPSTSKKTEQKEIKPTPDKNNKNKITKKGTPKKENDFKATSPKKKEDLVEDTKLLRKSVVRLNILKEKPSKLLKEKILDSKVVKKEEKIVISRKKVSMKKSDKSHSEGETSKTNVVVKRCTRQRPESLELENPPKLVKTTDVDDRFSDSDEEPLGNITGPTSSKQLNVRKSTASKKVIPLIKKEMSKKQSKNDEIAKVYDKQIKDDIIKSKSITKKDVSKKSIKPDNSSSSEGKCESKNECRSKTRYNKSIVEVPDKNKKIDNKCSKKIDVKKEELNTKDSLAINVNDSVLSKTKSKTVSKEGSESLELHSNSSVNKDSGVTSLNESISSKLESTTNVVDLNNSTNKNKLKQTKRCEEDNITLVEDLTEENSNVFKKCIKKNTNKFSTEKEACDSKEEVPQQVGSLPVKSPEKNVASSAPDLSSEPKSKKGKLKKLAPLDGKNALNKSIVKSCEDDKNMVVPQISSDVINISGPISDKSVTADSKLDLDMIINGDSLLPEPVHKSSDEPAKEIKNIANESIIENILSTKGKGDSEIKKEIMIASDKIEKGFKFEESSDIFNVNTDMKTNRDIKPKNVVLPDQPTSQDVQVHTSSPIMSETNYGQSTAASENNGLAAIGQTVSNYIQKDVQQFLYKKKEEGKNNSNNNDRKLPDSNFSTIIFDPQKIDHKTTGTVNNNFDNTESLGNPMKVIPKKTISTGQPLASKFVPYNIENPNLPILPMPKLNIEQQSVSKLEHTITSNKMPQQRQEIYWVDKNVSGKVEERNFFKEGTKSNLELRVSEDKSVMKTPQKNEQYFGNMKEVKSSAVIDPKFKPDVPLPGFQILKSSAKPKSMLKPGTLIDIAGGLNVGLQSESMNAFMRPPLDNAMTKAIKTDFVSDYSPAQSQGYNPAVPQPQRTDFNSEPPSFAQSKVKDEFVGKTDWAGTIKKERVESPIQFKNRTAVSNTWRQAFKNVKLPGESSTATSMDKPVVKKPLSVTALAKKHILTKSDTSSPEKSLPTQQSIPFLRQSKLFLGVNQSQVNKSRSSNVNVKPRPTEEIDMNNLREKEEEFLRSFVGGDFAKISTDLNNINVGIEKQIIQTETLIIQPRDEHIDLTLPKISNIDIRRTNSPIQNVSVSIEEKGLRFDNDRTKSNLKPFSSIETLTFWIGELVLLISMLLILGKVKSICSSRG
uniref:Uncharacterized protein n=1 Tax=Clastoptera arizonana TaxID=38151 RepID=A0A1B6DLJ6_9HEMI